VNAMSSIKDRADSPPAFSDSPFDRHRHTCCDVRLIEYRVNLKDL